MVLILIDILGREFNGLPGSFNIFLNEAINLLLYIMEPLGAMLWILYIKEQVCHNNTSNKKIKGNLILLFIINAVMCVVSLFTGWFFSIDSNNIYSRGELFFIPAGFCYTLLIYAFIFALRNRKNIEKRYYCSLILFFVPQTVGTVIQAFVYGVTYNWIGMALSILIIYFNMQNRGLNIDYLTGVCNRRYIDSFIKGKIKNATPEKSFSVILIDINHFKRINDTFGHGTGDEAIKDVVGILKKCINHNDLIVRYGGDEFFVMKDISEYQILEKAVVNIKENVTRFNESVKKPYDLSFSTGYYVYNYTSLMSTEDFLKHIDMLMYENKKHEQGNILCS